MSQKSVPGEIVQIASIIASTSGFVSNAIVGQAVDDRRRSWFQRMFKSRKSVDPENGIGKKKRRKFSTKRDSTDIPGNRLLDYSKINCLKDVYVICRLGGPYSEKL